MRQLTDLGPWLEE